MRRIRSPRKVGPFRNRGPSCASVGATRERVRESEREGQRRSIFQALFLAKYAPWTTRPRSCPESSPGAPRPSASRRPPRAPWRYGVEKPTSASCLRSPRCQRWLLPTPPIIVTGLLFDPPFFSIGSLAVFYNVSYRKLHEAEPGSREILHRARCWRVVVVSRPVGRGCGARGGFLRRRRIRGRARQCQGRAAWTLVRSKSSRNEPTSGGTRVEPTDLCTG